MSSALSFPAKRHRSPDAGTGNRRVGSALALWLACSLACGQIPEPSSSDAIDSRLIARLNQRQLFDVSADVARDRIRQSRHPETEAYWTDQLARVYVQQMWQESQVNRQARLQQSAELITEFLQGQAVRPETALAMRLTQIESLLTLARINLLLNTVGHRGPVPQDPEIAARGVLPLIDQAQELVDALLRQLRQNRGSLARSEVSLLRERGNQLSAELAVTRWLAGEAGRPATAPASNGYQKLRDEVLAFSRAARQPASRRAAARMLAELRLAAGDHAAVALSLRRQPAVLSEMQRLVFKLRMLLRQDKAMEALEATYTTTATDHLTPDELTVVRLEALLLLRMQADDLQDPGLKTRSDSALAEQTESIVSWPPSVWADAALKVLQRYELVKTVGAEVAELVEQVELLRTTGKPDEAARLLRRALRLLPGDAPARSQAALRLRLGEILIARSEWDEARTLLQESTELFVKAEQPAAAATAELYDVFCIGQQWRQDPQNTSLRDAYFNGLLQHRRRWDGEAAEAQATDWLIQLTQETDPMLATEVMAERADAADSRPERIERLMKLGEQLESVRHVDGPTRAEKSWSDLVQQLADTCAERNLISGELTDASAKLLLLCTSLTTDASTPLAEWGRLRKRLAEAESALVDEDTATRQRLSLLQLLSEVRSSTDTQRADERRTRYAVDLRANPSRGARQLARYLSRTGRIQPGDRAIAETLEQFITAQIPKTQTADGLSELLTLATLANRVTRNESIRQQLISQLLQLNLSADQATQIASAVMTSEAALNSPAAEGLKDLWQRIHDDTPEGSELWLESCVQLAQMQAATGEIKDLTDAARQLEVTSVIYPDWGSVDRKRRVQKFLSRARSAAKSQDLE